jgi:N-acetylneuraminate synthase/N,N'-diacetyllegionaminate synthase
MGAPAYIVAEIGLNHNGDMQLARKTIEEAQRAGADAVKFQNYVTEDFITDRSITYEYLSAGERVVESQYDMFKRCELSREQLGYLFDVCNELEMDVHSTPTTAQGVELLAELGVRVLKNGSDFLGNLPLIRTMAMSGLPTVLSTGMATIDEIHEAFSAFESAGGTDLILLHCTSSYPTPVEEINIRRIQSMAAAFGVPVGFSDHSEGVVAAVMSVTQGACWVEKHFTLNKELPGPDHWFSSDPEEFTQYVRSIRIAERAMGSSKIAPTLSEMQSREDFKLSVVARYDLEPGTILSEENLAVSRPGDGIKPAHMNYLLGNRLTRAVKKGQKLSFELVGG